MTDRLKGPHPSETLADKVDWLIGHAWPPDRAPARNNLEVAEAIAAFTGEDISSTTVWKLRTGRQVNPQLKTLAALASFFDIPFGYFGSAREAKAIGDSLTLTSLSRHVDEGTVAPEVLRALVGLSPRTRLIIGGMILAAAQADRAPV